MKNEQSVVAYLTISRRLPTSRNGNPRFECLLQRSGKPDLVAATGVDSSLAYGITEFTGCTVRAVVGEHYNRLTLANITANYGRGNLTETVAAD